MFEVIAHTESLEAKIKLLTNAMQNDSVGNVAGTYIEELPKLYARGVSGDGEPFPDYNAQYASYLNIARSPKTLSRGDGRLHELVLEGNIITVVDQDITTTSKSGKTYTANSRDVALGQQTGHKGSNPWGYSNIMFEQNPALENTAAHNLADYITERISL